MTTEIDYLIEKREGLNATTKTNYVNYYKRLRALTQTDISEMPNDKLIEIIDTAREADKKSGELKETPQSVKQSFLNIAIVIKQVFNKSTDALLRYRTIGSKKLVEANAVKNVELKETLPSVKKIMEFTNELYEKGDYVAFIINYLILTFNTRNKDLDLTIVKDGKVVSDKDNWLVLRKDSVRYMRFDFKTNETYECLENSIKSMKFINAVKEVLGDRDTKPLLMSGDTRIAKTSLNKYISTRTFENMGQAKMLKAILADKDDLKTLEKVSSNRGTAIQTLAENYAPSFKNEVGKMDTKTKKSGCKSKVAVSGVDKKTAKKKTKAQEIATAQAEHSDSE